MNSVVVTPPPQAGLFGRKGVPARRLAIVASHPIQYHAPLYRALAKEIDLEVFYAHHASGVDQARAGFGVCFDWDVPVLEGYRATWLTNRAWRPRIDRFWGCHTPDIGDRLRRGSFDAVVVQGWNLLSFWQAALACRRAGIPVMVRGDSHCATPRHLGLRLAKRIVYPPLLKTFDAFLSVGQRNREYLLSYGVPTEKMFWVPHVVDNEFFLTGAQTARQNLEPVKRRFGIAEDSVVFLFVGKFILQKRPLDFLRALDLLRQRGVRAWGLLIGDGPLRAVVKRHVAEHRTPCSFGGFLNQQEIREAYGVSDALVLPSASETWGLVVNEAMASGVPAIVSDHVGCAPDLIREGETGFSYPCGHVDDLAQQMVRVATDHRLRRSLSAGATKRASAFSVQAGCAGLLAAVDHVSRMRETA